MEREWFRVRRGDHCQFGLFQDLGCGKNCVPDMKVLSGAGKSEGSRNAAAGESAAVAVTADLSVAAAVPMRLRPLAVPEELSPAMYWLSAP